MMVLKMYLLSNMAILGIYVKFQGGYDFEIGNEVILVPTILSKEYTCSYQDVSSFDYIVEWNKIA